MTDSNAKPEPPWWPFFVVDALFFGLAAFICHQAHRPMLWWEAVVIVICAGVGAWSFITPFLRQSASAEKLAQAQSLADALTQLQQLESIAAAICQATSQWQGVQESAAKTADNARRTAESMAAETRAFTEFLRNAGESEKAQLRLQVEKLCRAEADWVQVLTRILDHVFALHQGALQSGQPKLIEQIGHFQNACRDTARRIGLAPAVAQTGDVFNPEAHQLAKGEAAPEKALITSMVATGYTYQGRLIRKTVVAVENDA